MTTYFLDNNALASQWDTWQADILLRDSIDRLC